MSIYAADLITEYLAGPPALRRVVVGMTREHLTARPIFGKWSTLEVVVHLADSEVAWCHRMMRVIAEDRPLLIGYDETRLAERLGYHDSEVEEELELFDRLRTQMAKILRRLPSDAWSRQGVHNERGLIRLDEMVRVESEHVLHHISQIKAKRQAMGMDTMV